MQSDTILYPEIYPDLFWLTHLYQRSFSNFLAELSFSPVFHAVKKSLFHSFNIAGVLALVIVVVRKRAAHEKGETRSEEYGLWAWVFCSFAFLIYAGSIQQEQNHYAAPMAIPAIFITAQLLSKFKLPWTVCLLLLQASAGFFYLSKYYIKNPSDWDQYSVESVVNQFSTRKDLFIDFNVEKIYDPTGLGQIQRRGMIYATIEDVEKYKNPYPYLFTRIDQNRSEQVSKLEALKKQYGEPFQSYHHFYFFKLKH